MAEVDTFLEESSSDEEQSSEEHAPDEKNLSFLRTVYVGNISYKATEDDLRKFFKDCGKIKDVKYPIHKTKKGSAFITFETSGGANEAHELRGSEMLGRTLNIRYRHKGHLSSKPKGCRIVFISNLDFKTTQSEIEAHFADCGEIVGVRIPTTKNGFKFGNAYVEFVDTKGVDEAMKLNNKPLRGRNIEVNWALPDKVEKTRKNLRESHTLLVGGMPFSYGVDAITKWFEKSGVDTSKCRIRLQRRSDGKSRGQAFVDFEETEDFFKVLKLNETVQGGRRVHISIALKKESSKRKLEDADERPKKKAKTWLGRMSEERVSKSFIIHGAPRSVEYTKISEMFSEFECQSFSREKASVLVTFESRKIMGKALESVNGVLLTGKSTCKIVPAIDSSLTKRSLTLCGVPKLLELSEIRKTLEEKFGAQIEVCYRVKKKIIVECPDRAARTMIIKNHFVELGGKKIQLRNKTE